ncbi:MAG TPA: hypothetical protein VJ548_15980 [Azospira sp.]|nr:hypothetical protein [Azospira sp.]
MSIVAAVVSLILLMSRTAEIAAIFQNGIALGHMHTAALAGHHALHRALLNPGFLPRSGTAPPPDTGQHQQEKQKFHYQYPDTLKIPTRIAEAGSLPGPTGKQARGRKGKIEGTGE